MNANVRTKLEMATRVLEFCRAHPRDDSGYATLLASLEELVKRGEALAAQQRAGGIAERSGAAHRRELRAEMHFALLRHLVRVGELAAKERPDLIGKFQLPPFNSTNKTFVVASKAMLAEGLANQELFLKLGQSPAMLEELSAGIQDFEASIESSLAGRAAHVGARADLEAVVAEMLTRVDLLDTINRRRFRNDPELAAAWETVRTVIGPAKRKPSAPPAPESEASGGTAVA